jgi:alpha-tubulin suppressor-like RCC1 family protein
MDVRLRRAGIWLALVLTAPACAGGGGGDGGSGVLPTEPSPPAPPPNQVTIASGDGQSAIAGSKLPSPLVVKVTTGAGVPIAGASVAFQVSKGTATVDPATATTDAAGSAQTTVTFGKSIGAVTVTATASSVPNTSVTFTVTPRLEFRSVSAGRNHTCAGTDLSGVYCWGANDVGQLGNGTTLSSSVPQAVEFSAPGLIDAFAGSTHSCGLTASGGLFCWGANNTGQLGDGTATPRSTPVPVNVGGTRFSIGGVSLGDSHSCAISIFDVLCWGSNADGQLGDGTLTNRPTPVKVVLPFNAPHFTQVAAGSGRSCGVTSTAGLSCWGRRSPTSTPTAIVIANPPAWRTVATGRDHDCALTVNGAVYCWGANDAGQVGDGTTENRTLPVPVLMPAGVTVSWIVVGLKHSCAFSFGHAMYCWGANASGQLGDGTTTNRLQPTLVKFPPGPFAVTQISAGDDQTCAVAKPVIYCWGGNVQGQLGDGSTVNRTVPTPVTSQ